jgi:hypothetical protein
MNDWMIKNKQLEYVMYEHHLMTKEDLNILYKDRWNMYNYQDKLNQLLD